MLATEIIAHRGLSSLCPENTMIAMKAAAKIGVAWVEADVQILADDTPIIMHDEDFSRTTTLQGEVYTKNQQDIEHVDAGGWFDSRFDKEQIPCLSDMLNLIDELNLGVNLEIKYHPGYHEKLPHEKIKSIVENIEDIISISPPPPRGLFVSSFYTPFLEELRTINTHINIACMHSKYHEDIVPQAKALQARCLCVAKEMLLDVDEDTAKKRTARIKDTGMDLYVFTVNEVTAAKTLFAMGVDGIFTDYPQSFARYLP